MSGRARKYDYAALKRQYVATPGLSFRDLLKRNNIPENARAGVQRIASAEGWDEERRQVVERSTEKTIDLVADAEARRALRIAQVENNALDMADEMIDQVRGRLKKLNPVVHFNEEKGEEEIVDYVPDLLVRPEELGKVLKGLSDMRSASPAPQPNGGNGGAGAITLPPGTELALVARYVDRVRDEGGPIPDDEFTPPAGSPAGLGLPSGAAGAGEGAV